MAKLVPIADLSVSDSPRMYGLKEEHVQLLIETAEPLPPIVVHRSTMQVVDGRHRLQAARVRGENQIAVHFVDCSPSEIFVEAVRANVAHGLPLSLAERKAAATRIVTSHPHWSDRAIAAATGLAHKTVGRIRQEHPDLVANTEVRTGRDGRAHRMKHHGSAIAADIISRSPELTLREVARAAGISVSTAHEVRLRLRRGDRDVLAVPSQAADRSMNAASMRSKTVVRSLQADPSIRFTDSGRTLLRLLGSHPPDDDEWRQLVDSVPVRWASTVAGLAREYASAWRGVATRLDEITQRRVT